MWLVLCSPQDLPAIWAAQGLRRLGFAPVEIVTAEALAYNLRFEHRLEGGTSFTQIALADGRTIDSRSVRGVLNRLDTLPTGHLSLVTPEDRQYAEQELFATFLSWLNGLRDPVFNRPAPRGLAGSSRHLSEWIWLASRAGLSTLSYQQGDLHPAAVLPPPRHATTASLIVCNGRCFGPLRPPAAVESGCARLAERSGDALLGIYFCVLPSGEWQFAEAATLPDLRSGGDALLAELARSFHS